MLHFFYFMLQLIVRGDEMVIWILILAVIDLIVWGFAWRELVHYGRRRMEKPPRRLVVLFVLGIVVTIALVIILIQLLRILN